MVEIRETRCERCDSRARQRESYSSDQKSGPSREKETSVRRRDRPIRNSDQQDLHVDEVGLGITRVTTTPGGGDELSDLHTKMAHIQWRKHANDRSIRKALDTTKRLRERDLMIQLAVDREGERERWTEAVVRDEMARPADISDIFLKTWEQQAEKDRRRQLQEKKLHLKSLKRIERIVQSKKEGMAGGATSMAQQPERSNAGQKGGQREYRQNEAALLKERLQRLRIGVNEKRRELRRSASSSKSLRETFNA